MLEEEAHVVPRIMISSELRSVTEALSLIHIFIMKRIHNIDELKRGDIVHWNFPSYTYIPSNTSTLGLVVGFHNEHLELKHGDI